jgi:hypothetical protein
MSVKDDFRNPNSLYYKCTKASLLITRFGYRRDVQKEVIRRVCADFGITVKQLKKHEKEYWEKINKVKDGTFGKEVVNES